MYKYKIQEILQLRRIVTVSGSSSSLMDTKPLESTVKNTCIDLLHPIRFKIEMEESQNRPGLLI